MFVLLLLKFIDGQAVVFSVYRTKGALYYKKNIIVLVWPRAAHAPIAV